MLQQREYSQPDHVRRRVEAGGQQQLSEPDQLLLLQFSSFNVVVDHPAQ
jgi:hypothetical protein